MTREIVIRNRQRRRRVDAPRLRAVAAGLLDRELALPTYALGITLVTPAAMTQVNEGYLGHEGPTDVITFDHRRRKNEPLHGELFICLEEAAAFAREFQTTWPEELARYVVHGVLHLLGHDDRDPPGRRRMRRAENRLVRALARHFDLPALARPSSLRA
ncbi:MAG: rRNA maturation RNase YbeY [Limisphaerales bacterium]